MGIPLVALASRTPDPLQQAAADQDSQIKAQQLRGMLLGQQFTQASTQGRQLENQGLQQSLDTQRQIVAASHDQAWDPTDPDAVLKTLSRYNVPLAAQATVMQGITSIRTGLNNASKEDLAAADSAHSYMDDQLQSAKNAPEGEREKTYQAALENIAQYASNLAPGMRQQIMRELGGAPPIFNPQWVDRQHGLLKTESALTKDALEKAQTAEAAGKGAQSQAEAGLATARTPGATAESTIQQQQADLTPQGRALAGNLFYGAGGGDPQSQQALNLETGQKIAVAQAGVAGAPSALHGVAPHLVVPATAAYDKAGQDYATAYQAAQNMSDFLQQARSGNKAAVKIVPLQGALEITTAQGVHRINRTEVDQYAGAGNLYDKLAGGIGGVISGKNISDSVLNDMDALQQTVSQNAKTLHANKVATINESYGSNFQPMDFSKTSGGNAAQAQGGAPAGRAGHVIDISGKRYRYNGSGDTADIKNYTQVGR